MVRELRIGRRTNVFRVLFTIDGDAVRIHRIVRTQRRVPRIRSRSESHNPRSSEQIGLAGSISFWQNKGDESSATGSPAFAAASRDDDILSSAHHVGAWTSVTSERQLRFP